MNQIVGIISYIGLMCIPFSFFAQERVNGKYFSLADSLLSQKYSDAAWRTRDQDIDSSLIYGRLALMYAKHFKQKQLEAYSYSDIGNCYKKKERFDSAQWYLRESLELRLSLKNQRDQASGYNLIGLLFLQQQKFDSAISFFEKGLEMIHGEEMQSMRAKLLDGKGICKLHIGNYIDALSLIKESLNIHELTGDSLGIAKSYQNMGLVYQKTRQITKALETYKYSRSIYQQLNVNMGMIDIMINEAGIMALSGNFEEAERVFLESLRLSAKEGFVENYSVIYPNLAFIYESKQQFPKALTFHQKSFALAQETGKNFNLIESGINMGEIYFKLENFPAATEILDHVEKSLDTAAFPILYARFAQLKGKIYASIEEYGKAYETLIESQELLERVEEELNSTQNFADEILLIKQEKERLENTVSMQKLEIQNQKIRNQLWFILLVGGAIILMLSLLYLLTRLHNQKLAVDRLEAKNIALREREKRLEKDEEISNVMKMAELSKLEAKLETEKSVREQIAKDLHDQLGSNLALLQIQLEGMKQHLRELAPNRKEKFQEILEFLDATCSSFRGLAVKMNDQQFTYGTLITELKAFCSSISKSGLISVDFIHTGFSSDIPESSLTEIYAITKTLIDNILRHSEATEATIQLFEESGVLLLSVEDNGKGFNRQSKDFRAGMGIRNIYSRIEKLEGEVNLESSIGKGTLVTVQIPSNYDKDHTR